MTSFECDNGRCVDTFAQCDGINNCGDYFDELHCPGSFRLTLRLASNTLISFMKSLKTCLFCQTFTTSLHLSIYFTTSLFNLFL